MLKTLVVVGTILGSLLPVAASAQTAPTHCPPNYQLAGGVCQDPGSGDVVQPD